MALKCQDCRGELDLGKETQVKKIEGSFTKSVVPCRKCGKWYTLQGELVEVK